MYVSIANVYHQCQELFSMKEGGTIFPIVARRLCGRDPFPCTAVSSNWVDCLILVHIFLMVVISDGRLFTRD